MHEEPAAERFAAPRHQRCRTWAHRRTWVAGDRPPACRQVHADLVHAAGHQATNEKGRATTARQTLELSQAFCPDRRRGHHATSIAGIAAKLEGDPPARHVHAAVHDRQVVFLRDEHRSLQLCVHVGPLRHDHHARCQLVEAPDDRRSPGCRPRSPVRHHTVEQRSGRMVVCRVHHDARRLRHGQEVFVLVQDL